MLQISLDKDPTLCPGNFICLDQVWDGALFEISIDADLFRHRIVDQIYIFRAPHQAYNNFMMKKNNQEEKKALPLKQKRFAQGLPVLNPYAAGIDIGDSKYDVALPCNDGHEVREYATFTCDLKNMVKWLKEEGITTVAMESTGIYWLNLYLMLEEEGIEPYLVNARHAKNVTGRKRDDTDAIWLQKLHSCGLLQKSFQPEGTLRTLREYVRQRKRLTNDRSDTVRRMQKALEMMNVKLHIVISDILGKTGMQMVQAILQGERDPDILLKLKDHRIKASDEDIRKSLDGIWKEELLFMLQQAYDGYCFYQKQIKQCEEKIKEILLSMAAKILDGDITNLGATRDKKPQKNDLSFNVQKILHIIVGVDLCKITSISEVTALELISEIGTDMTKWKSGKHFSAWLNLTPNTKITGGKVISSKMQKKKNQAGITLRMAASNLSKSKSHLGDYARKMRSRIGKKGAVIASAHKLSRIIYAMIKEKAEFDMNIYVDSQKMWKEQRIKQLENQLKHLRNVA